MNEGAQRRWAASRWWRWGRWLAPCAVLVSVVAVLLGARRARDDPRHCTDSCHTAARHPAPWRASGGHPTVACQRCHQSTARSVVALAWARLVGASTPRHAGVTSSGCGSCHDASTEQRRQVLDTAGHREHGPGVTKVDCLSCHRQSTHGAQKPEQQCSSCHASDQLHAKTPAGDECLACHNFSAGARGLERLTVGQCDRCHEGREKLAAARPGDTVPASLVVNGEMLHGGVDCKLCHQPHRAMPREAVDGGAVAGERVCRRCHEIELEVGGRRAPEGHQNCVKCHSAHAPIDELAAPCVKCHEQGRARVAAQRSTAEHHDSCASCHLPHTWQAARSGCVQCHRDKASLVHAEAPSGHQDCASCHQPHDPAPTGQICVGCHRDRAGHSKTAPGRHRDCVSCHDPHSARQRPAAACTNCHAGPNRQLLHDGPARHAEKGCFGCHAAHGNPALGQEPCGKCHQDQRTRVAKAGPDQHRRCASCHQSHGFFAAACTSCHESVAKSPGAHAGTCNECHAQHGSPAVSRADCLRCHQGVQVRAAPGNAQHADCGSCHQAHRSAGAAVGQCGSCHQSQAKGQRGWPAGTPHAGPCDGCHRPHDARQPKSCDGCHQKQAAAARGGRHQCDQCHAPHQAPPGQGAAWWQRCSSCHAAQAAAARTAGATHSQCSKCHQPHAFGEPSCGSCHASIMGQAGHAKKGHDNCTSCHATHGASQPERAQCLRCHQDKVRHEPAAQRCQACHPFR